MIGRIAITLLFIPAYFRGDLLTIKCTFSVTLADFGIKNPAIQDGKVAKQIKITANLTLSAQPPGA